MTETTKRRLVALASVAALGLGGAAVADAVSSGTNSAQTSGAAQTGSRSTETALTGDTAAKVKAAALAKTGGGTVDRVETDADGHAAYEAHITKADGTHVTVYVNRQFDVVGSDTGGPRGRHGRHGRGAETALTGDTAAKVKAAALAKTGGGTVDRVENDADGHAPFEAHITKADGTHVTVYVDAQFNVVGVETGR